MKRYNLRYAVIFAVLLIAEILIGAYLNSGIVRGYIGDMLVMPAIYFFIRTFWNKPSRGNTLLLPAALFILGTAAELLQAVDITGILGIEKGSILAISLGTVCDPVDMLCYGIGIVFVYIYLFSEKKIMEAKES